MEYFVGVNKQVEKCIVAVAGGTASGKTNIVNRMMSMFQEIRSTNKVQILCVSLDDFYRNLKPNESHKTYNFDEPDAINILEARELIEKFLEGDEILIPTYDFTTHSRTHHGARFELNPFADRVIIIVEGIHALHKDLLPIYDIKIWIQTEEDVRKSRRIMRDVNERGRTADFVSYQWETFAQPTFSKYESQYRRDADVEINNTQNPPTPEELQLLCNRMLGL